MRIYVTVRLFLNHWFAQPFTIALFPSAQRHPAVLELEINYLCTHYHDPEIASRWSGLVEKLCHGDNPHAASMMVLLFQRLVPRAKGASSAWGSAGASDSAPCEDELPEWIECSYGGWAAALRG